MTRRGLALPAGLLTAALSPRVLSAAVPPRLMSATVRAAAGGLGNATAAGTVSASVASLIQAVQRTVILAQLRVLGTAVLAGGIVAGGVAGLGKQLLGNGPQRDARASVERPTSTVSTPAPSRPDEGSPAATTPGEVAVGGGEEHREGWKGHRREKDRRAQGERGRDRERGRARKPEGDRAEGPALPSSESDGPSRMDKGTIELIAMARSGHPGAVSGSSAPCTTTT